MTQFKEISHALESSYCASHAIDRHCHESKAKKITSLNVNTYMGETKDSLTLQVQMASLPDGTNYSQQTVLNATAKKLEVTTTNSNYQKLAGY